MLGQNHQGPPPMRRSGFFILKAFFTLSVCLGTGRGGIAAVTMGFDDLKPGVASYVEDEIRLSISGGAVFRMDDRPRVYELPAKPPVLGISHHSGPITLQSELGKTFKLHSIDISELNRDVGPQKITFLGRTTSGRTVSYSFSTDGPFGFETVRFPTSFTDLTSVNWGKDEQAIVLYDNIVVGLQEPDPNLLAYFPLDTGPEDATGNSPPMRLKNTEFKNESLYLNGKYSWKGKRGKGYDARVLIPGLNFKRFSVAFNFYALVFDPSTKRDNLITAGSSTRWFGLSYDRGYLSLSFNNHDFRYTFDGQESRLRYRRWHHLACSVDLVKGKVSVILDGKALQTVDLPKDYPLGVEMNPKWRNKDENEFIFTDYARGAVFYGYVDNLRIYDHALDQATMKRLYMESRREPAGK